MKIKLITLIVVLAIAGTVGVMLLITNKDFGLMRTDKNDNGIIINEQENVSVVEEKISNEIEEKNEINKLYDVKGNYQENIYTEYKDDTYKNSYLYKYIHNGTKIKTLLPERKELYDGEEMYITDIKQKDNGNYLVKYKICRIYGLDAFSEEWDDKVAKGEITVEGIEYKIYETDDGMLRMEAVNEKSEFIVYGSEYGMLMKENPTEEMEEFEIEISKNALINEIHVDIGLTYGVENISNLYEKFNSEEEYRRFNVIVDNNIGVELFYVSFAI